MSVITRLGAPRRSKLLHRIIRLCERNTEAVLFELAERSATPGVPEPRRPHSAPRGFRWKRIRGNRVFSHSRARLSRSAGFAARVRRLIQVLADPERCVARCLKALVVGFKCACLVAVAPPAQAVRVLSRPAISLADSS